MKWPVLAVLGSLVAATAALAQTASQTPESAGRFLAVQLKGAGFNPNHWKADGAYESVPFYGLVSSFEFGSGPCDGIVTAVYAPSYFHDGINWSPPQSSISLKFDDVSQVEDDGASLIKIYSRSRPRPLLFRVAVANQRARVAYAFEYLRDRCDPSADTGF